MKRELIILLICILLVQVVYAETTFFEGDLGYRGDFIIANLPEEVIEAGVEILPSGGGGYFLRQAYNKTLVCDVCSDSLRQHIKEEQNIDYNEDEIVILTYEINQEFQTDLSNNQVRYIIENFEDECDAPYPLLGGFAGGRFSNLLDPLVLTITIILLLSIIITGYLIIRTLKKRGYGRRKKSKKRNKLKKHKFK